NFYTPTVYEKGAEICRMMKTLIGEKAFRKAMDLYFERHDGEAATVEDFVRCMADASGRDLTQFFRWYEQAGTPHVNVSTHYDAKAKTFDLTLAQKTAPTPGQADKQPMHIPDKDTFNRWEAGQSLGKSLIIANLAALRDKLPPPRSKGYADALQKTLTDKTLDAAFKALMLGLPTEADIAAAIAKDVDTDLVLQSRNRLRAELGAELKDILLAIWKDTEERGAYAPTPENTGRRSLRYAALGLLAAGAPKIAVDLIQRDLAKASNMTAEIGALSALAGIDAPETNFELEKFHTRHAGDSLLVDKWFSLHSQVATPGAAARIEALMGHPDFRLSTP
ncbi:MAG: DUF3458 domain-containing protein, partial [Aestuariivirga sp.]